MNGGKTVDVDDISEVEKKLLKDNNYMVLHWMQFDISGCHIQKTFFVKCSLQSHEDNLYSTSRESVHFGNGEFSIIRP